MAIGNLQFCDETKAFIFAFKIVHGDSCHPIIAMFFRW